MSQWEATTRETEDVLEPEESRRCLAGGNILYYEDYNTTSGIVWLSGSWEDLPTYTLE